MRPIALLTFATAALLGLATARAEAPASSSCLAECDAAGLSADDQATCRLQCARLAQSAAPPAARPPAAPSAARPPAAPSPAPRPAQPVAQPAPDLAHQKFLCESQCDAEPNPGDRSTCRLQCAQIYRASAAPPPASAPVSSHTSGATTTYSFAPGGGHVPAAPVGGSHVPAAPAGGPTYSPHAQQQQQIAACQATCDREASPTDRATCRNNCGAVGTVVGPAAPSQWVLGPAPTMSAAEQRAAVIRSSTGVVSSAPAPGAQPAAPASAPGAPPAARPGAPAGQPAAPPQTAAPGAQQPPNPQCAAQAQSCKVGCASEQTTCSAQCDQGKMSETDRATCKLTCTTVGDACRDDCRMKEAACKPPVYR